MGALSTSFTEYVYDITIRYWQDAILAPNGLHCCEASVGGHNGITVLNQFAT